VIAGLQQVVAQLHAAGKRVIGGTITPDEGCIYGCYSASAETAREAVNAWIRSSGTFDAVVDFDQALRDPADPHQLLPAYDSGDHLHPNDAGYRAMANAVNLATLRNLAANDAVR
jgi:lysophospholipase L1-like esterase